VTAQAATAAAVRSVHAGPDALLSEVRAAVARWSREARGDPELYVWIAGEAGSVTRRRRHRLTARAFVVRVRIR